MTAAAPIRTCLACRERAPQDELLRLGLVQGVVKADPGRRLPGRGAYVHPRPQCLERLIGAPPGGRAFRRPLGPEAWRELARELEVGPEHS